MFCNTIIVHQSRQSDCLGAIGGALPLYSALVYMKDWLTVLSTYLPRFSSVDECGFLLFLLSDEQFQRYD